MEWLPGDRALAVNWPVPSRRRRLFAAVVDLSVVVLVCSPILVAGWNILQRNLREWFNVCMDPSHAAQSKLCLHNAHVSEVNSYAFSVSMVIVVVGAAYFTILQSSTKRRTLGEWLAGLTLIRDYPPDPLTKAGLGRPALRFFYGLFWVVPVVIVGLQLWNDPGAGLFCLAVFSILAAVCWRQILRGIPPAPRTGALIWDRWSATTVIAYGAPKLRGLAKPGEPVDMPELVQG